MEVSGPLQSAAGTHHAGAATARGEPSAAVQAEAAAAAGPSTPTLLASAARMLTAASLPLCCLQVLLRWLPGPVCAQRDRDPQSPRRLPGLLPRPRENIRADIHHLRPAAPVHRLLHAGAALLPNRHSRAGARVCGRATGWQDDGCCSVLQSSSSSPDSSRHAHTHTAMHQRVCPCVAVVSVVQHTHPTPAHPWLARVCLCLVCVCV